MKEPHVFTPAHDPGRMCPTCGRGGRPFEDYRDQPGAADRTRLAVQSLPFALPEKRFRYGEPFGPGHKTDCPCDYCKTKVTNGT